MLKRKSIQEDLVITIPFFAATSTLVNVEKSPSGVDQGFFTEESPIRPEETLGDYYYRSYLRRELPIFMRLYGSSSKAIPFLIGRFVVIGYKASKKEASEEKARVALLRAKLEVDQAKFESEQKTEEWSTAGWKRKVESETALLSRERRRWREICEKDNNEKMGRRNNINNLKVEFEKLNKEKTEAEAARDEERSHRERSEQREVQTCATLALKNMEIDELTSLLSDQEQIQAELESAKKVLQLERVKKVETSRRLAETKGKL
ncbi:hypothetical protein Hanom_Chr07g00619391 [Helianthus anomalus]